MTRPGPLAACRRRRLGRVSKMTVFRGSRNSKQYCSRHLTNMHRSQQQLNRTALNQQHCCRAKYWCSRGGDSLRAIYVALRLKKRWEFIRLSSSLKANLKRISCLCHQRNCESISSLASNSLPDFVFPRYPKYER